jgi:transmembrane sensor
MSVADSKVSSRSPDEEAAELFVQRLQAEWTARDQAELDARRARDPAFEDAFSRAESSWGSLDQHAETPEIMRHREAALAFARRANARRWSVAARRMKRPRTLVAAITGVAIALGAAWQLSPLAFVPGQYETQLGEQRTLDLGDHSRIALDAMTRIRVRYSKDTRLIDLKYGQAQFNVAHDPARPFKVIAGNHEIVAVGTVFTVEYANHEMHVAMLEGKVAVVDQSAPVAERHTKSSSRSVARTKSLELAAGEEMRVNASGEATVSRQADLEAATAWREGKIIFRAEPLEEAIRRVNRYSHTQIDLQVDALASSKINGVFETGDTQGFVDAIERYLPVTADTTEPDRIQLRAR